VLLNAPLVIGARLEVEEEKEEEEVAFFEGGQALDISNRPTHMGGPAVPRSNRDESMEDCRNSRKKQKRRK